MALIDEILQDAMRNGHFNDLPGAGKPLKLDDDALVPETQRMAHKLLRDNDLVPDWMAQGKELDAERDRLIAALRRAASAEALDALRARAAQHNKQVLSYNLKVPKGVVHKRHFDFEAELSKIR